MNTKKSLIILIFQLFLFKKSFSQEYTYFYDSLNDKIIFNSYSSSPSYIQLINKNNQPMKLAKYSNETELENKTIVYSSEILTESNKIKSYSSKQVDGEFNIDYYKIKYIDTELSLVKVNFITEEDSYSVTEVIIDLYEKYNKNNKIIFPNKYYNDFDIEQNKLQSKEAYQRRDKKIWDTYGFNIRVSEGINYDLAKVLVINYRKKEVNYLANLSGAIFIKKGNEIKVKTYDFFLKNLPENFDLVITLDILDEKGEKTGEKVTIVKKNLDYPNYKVEDANPNKKMFIIACIAIGLALVVTIIFVIIKLIL